MGTTRVHVDFHLQRQRGEKVVQGKRRGARGRRGEGKEHSLLERLRRTRVDEVRLVPVPVDAELMQLHMLVKDTRSGFGRIVRRGVDVQLLQNDSGAERSSVAGTRMRKPHHTYTGSSKRR